MSTLEKQIEIFAETSRRYPSELRRLKKQGKKIVCWYGSYIPVEIIHASGALQYPLFDGGSPEPVEIALQYLQFTTNPQARFQAGLYMMGLDPVVPIADLIIIDSKEADSVRVGNIFELHGLPVMYLGVPQDWEKKIAYDYYKRQLNKLKEVLEKLTGEKITNEMLLESIRKYNRIRELLSEIESFRKEHPPVIGGENFIKLNHYALRCDPDITISFLEKVVGTLKEEKKRAFSEDVKRIMVIGRGFAFGDYILLRMIEELGGVVVANLLDEGIIHQEKVRTDGDPIENIAERYYRVKVPACPLTPSFRRRWEHIAWLVKEYCIDGLLYYQLAFDVIYDHEWPIFSKRASEIGIPFIMVEVAYNFSREATETLKSRVESFIKICRSGGK
ncbi:MAG: 2-hydroxyacyl-CoA dehydratase family protein [Candidatus Bathyarchaeia archaeon]